MQPGDEFDRYTIEAQLGVGGMGEVYAAYDNRLVRRVALKLIRGDVSTEARQRLLREARTAAALEHPNAVVIYDVGEHDDIPYIAMELVRGKTIRAYIGDQGVPVERRIQWLVDVARALAAAHRVGLVHRDIKPDNVMVREDGTVKVLDFGIARRRRRPIDETAPTIPPPGQGSTGAQGDDGGSGDPLGIMSAQGALVGTPMYSAPEQLRQQEELDGRADQFSWGVMAYELFTGVLPWSGSDAVGVLSQIIHHEPPSLAERAPDLPPEVVQVVERALRKKPDERFADIDEAAELLDPFSESWLTEPSISTVIRVPTLPEIGTADTVAPGGGVAAPNPSHRLLRFGIGALALFGGVLLFSIIAGTIRDFKAAPAPLQAEAGGPLLVDALSCQPAAVTGERAAELSRAIGLGACARLASEIDVDWAVPTANYGLDVSAIVGSERTEITLAIADRHVSASGPTPLDAIASGVQKLAPQLTSPPMSAAQIKAWGAEDEAGARRIERVWRRMVLHISPDRTAEIRRLFDTDPGSPWPYAFAALVSPGTSSSATMREKALSLADKLPESRTRALRAALIFEGSEAEQRQALGLLRQAYNDAPDDPDIAAIYAALAIVNITTADEGYAVAERVSARFPSHSVLALRNAIRPDRARNLARDAKYLARLRDLLPESLSWPESVRHLVMAGRTDEARAALDFGRALGLAGASSDAARVDRERAWVELTSLKPESAREIASGILGDPRIDIATDGASTIIASYEMEARLIDADSARFREMERQSSMSSTRLWTFAIGDLRLRRWLSRSPPPHARLGDLARWLRAREEAEPIFAAMVRVELALARSRAGGLKRDAAETEITAIETLADRISEGDRSVHDSIQLASLPLVRYARGAAEAAKLWKQLDRAIFRVRRHMAFDAALALESAADADGAEEAYKLAMDPFDLENSGNGFAATAARVRLSELYRNKNWVGEASWLTGQIERLWSSADPGIQDAVLKLQ